MKKHLFFLIACLFFGHELVAQNDFENGVSPSTYRYFFPDRRDGEYKMMIFQTEGMDGINYFGSRLQDINLDGKIDYVYRIKEHLEGEWDYPSSEPRIFVRGDISSDFQMQLVKDDQLLFGGENIKYYEDETGEYFYNWAWGDPTVITQIGIEDWRGFFERYGYIENVDYAHDGQYIEFIPRLYKIKNGEILDITEDKLSFVEAIDSTRARFPWDQSISSGDYDNDGDIDILMTGSHRSTTNLSGLPDFDDNNKDMFYFFENMGNGRLVGSPLRIVGIDQSWWIAEGTKRYTTNIDGIPGDEAIGEIWLYENGNQGILTSEKKFGYFKVNKSEAEVEFHELFRDEEYLLNPSWNIFPKIVLPMDFVEDRELVLYFFTSPSGSPPQTNVGETRFDQGVIQQYFRVYEFLPGDSGAKTVVDVTSEFFYSDEYKTLSLDNSGTIHFIDVDGDGRTDLFPQIGATPYEVLGGIQQFLRSPAWNEKTNTIYYFKQLENGKFKITDLAEIDGFYWPKNFDNDFSVFNDSGEFISNGTTFRFENFTLLNTVSLNDIDNDNRFEIISSSQPDYLHIFTKSDLPSTGLESVDIVSSTITKFNSGNKHDRYDFSQFSLPKDTIYLNIYNIV